MEPKARHILIGAFTVGCIIAILLFGLWLTRSGINQNSQRYVVHFKESVSGLSRGSAVLFSGMSVGEVVDLSLDKKDPSHVYALISVKKEVPLHEGVQARLQLMGITGQQVIALRGGDTTKPLLIHSTVVEKEDDLPVITAVPSPLSALFEGGQNAVSNLTEISVNLKTLFSKENMQHIGNILNHIDSVTGAVASEDEAIKSIVNVASKSMVELNKTLESFSQLAGNITHLLNDEGKKALSSAVNAMNSLAVSSQHIQRLVLNNETNLNQGLQGFKEITPAIIEFKRAFGTLQNILRNMEDNPAGYFIDGSSLKEFKP
ncbi:MlaD family protein [Pelistega ratti]|uniref:MlaD family protein n=1 Tax=Pelistega ratti TaxID=2652177 RepID=UPI00135BE2D5|nr:MlaD family protein [Pelistega ratti]